MNPDKQMTERELAAHIDTAEQAAVVDYGDFYEDQEQYLQYYNADPFGNEIEGRSQVVSTDVRDLVESDMPSLVRVFLGAGDPVEFRAHTDTEIAIQEAKDRQKLVSSIIKGCKHSWRTQHDWLKSSEIQSVAALEYGLEEVQTTRVKRYKGMSEDELAVLVTELEDEKGVESVAIVEQDDGGLTEEGSATFDVAIRITLKRNEYFLRNIPVDDLIISRNAWNKDDADIVGKRFTKTRGQLIEEGFDIDLVKGLAGGGQASESNSLKQRRYNRQGGEEMTSAINAWANEEVDGIDCYVKIDFDGDGIAERRHVIKIGKEVLVNEPFDHVPYAIISSMLMPNNIIGLPRAELGMQYQETMSVLRRQILDNIYAVNNPRHVVSDNVDLDDMLDIRLNGVVRTDGIPQQDVFPLTTPYIGDKALQVVTYLDSARSQSTGSLMTNQGLEADNLHKETATRFEGMEAAATAKIELVARVIAEVGYRDLWEGIAWFASHYQDTELETQILGREMIVDPTNWKQDHKIAAVVGTGAGDDEKTLQNLSSIYAMQTQLIQEGSVLADDQKRYNTLATMIKTIGRDQVSDFANNPEQPQQILQAENEILKRQMQMMQENMQNPLAEAEQVKAQASLQKTQLEQKFEGQVKMMEMEQANNKQLREAMEKYQSDLRELQFKYAQMASKTGFDYTKLAAEQDESAGEIQQIRQQMSGMSNEQLLQILDGGQ